MTLGLSADGTMIRHGDRGLRLVALSFDDGPSAHTEALLERLAELELPATFFLVGERIAGRESLVAAIAAAGHEIGSHSWSHAALARRPLRALRELRRSRAALLQAGAPAVDLFRPPYGYSSRRLAWVARRSGQRPVSWDVDPADWRGRPAVEIAAEVTGAALGGSIVLLHEGPGTASVLEALPEIGAGLRRRGLRFATVSELLAAGRRGPGAPAG